jgi:deoxycytidine triphosphate deaminase
MTARRHSDELRRVLRARLRAITEGVDGLHGRLDDSSQQLAHALQIVRAYPDHATAALEAEWATNNDEDLRVTFIRSIMQQTVSVENTLDTWLVQSYDAPVPSALVRALEREFERMGQPREAVLSMSPSDGYVTYVAELADKVLAPLSLRVPRPDSQLRERRFALIQIPRLQVDDPTTWPVILGHEAAHLSLLAKPEPFGQVTIPAKTYWLDLARELYSGKARTEREEANLANFLFEAAHNWLEELLCDAYAVRRFGPAAIPALAAFLDMVGSMEKPGNEHPPGRLRVSLMLSWLGTTEKPRVAALLEPWIQAVGSVNGYRNKVMQPLIDLFAGSIGSQIAKSLADWPEYSINEDRVLTRADSLLAGQPGLYTPAPFPVPTAEDDAEAVNAAWVAVVEQENSPPEGRVPVERLSAKTLDIHEFIRLWHEASESAKLPVERELVEDDSPAPSGAVNLSKRLRSSSSSGDLGVFPLFPDALSGASVDLRLGTQFIVFRRVAVASFDPVSDRSDPRSFQTVVDKAWGRPFVLHPGELALATTLEYLVIPDDLSAQVVGRSSYGRLGLLPATAVFVHPGFRGCLTLELVNQGTVPISVTPGQRVAQLVVQPATSSGPRSTKYDCPTKPEFSKVSKDIELRVLAHLRSL